MTSDRRYWRTAKKGALARAGAGLHTTKVAMLPEGVACRSSGGATLPGGVERVHLREPIVGWVSAKCLTAVAPPPEPPEPPPKPARAPKPHKPSPPKSTAPERSAAPRPRPTFSDADAPAPRYGAAGAVRRVRFDDPALPGLIAGRREPVVIVDSPLCAGLEAYDVAKIGARCDGGTHVVLRDRERRENHEFVFHAAENTASASPYDRRFSTEPLEMTLGDFAGRVNAGATDLYLQTVVLETPVHHLPDGAELFDDEGLPPASDVAPPFAGAAFRRADNGLVADCRDLADWAWLGDLVAKSHLPRPATLYLLAGCRGGASPLHYDMRANLFTMVAGRKRFWLAPPDAWRDLRPHAVTSPLDRRARAAPAAYAGGAAVTLEPGETLFIPPYHWHDVQQVDATTVSLALWFLSDRPTEPRAAGLKRARDVEAFAAAAAGERGAAALLRRAADGAGDADAAAVRAAAAGEPPGFLEAVAARLFQEAGA